MHQASHDMTVLAYVLVYFFTVTPLAILVGRWLRYCAAQDELTVQECADIQKLAAQEQARR